MITVKKISREVVRPIPREEIPEDRIKGYKLFPTLSSNIFLLAKKRSGKTSVINKILKSCINKQTKVYIFASTVYKDDNWKHIVKWLKDSEIEHHIFTAIKEGKVNHLTNIMELLQPEDESSDSSEDENPSAEVVLKYAYEKSLAVSIRKPRKVASENVFIFDDLGESLRNSAVNTLLKTNFHYKAKVIISSQYLNDLKPEARKQLDYVLIFGGNSEEKLMTLHQDIDISIPFEVFYQLYKDATQERYHFLYVDTRRDVYRKDFNYQYDLPKV